MAILAYWKYENYLADTEEGFGFNFNSNQRRLHDEVQEADDIFLVTGVRTGGSFEIFLVGHLVVSAKTLNAPGFVYGRYRLCGHERLSRYFVTGEQPLTPFLERLSGIQHFSRTEWHKYSQSFQTIRKLSPADAGELLAFAKMLKIHPTSDYRFPELEYEESVGDENRIEHLVDGERIPAHSRRAYVRRAARNRTLVRELNDLYVGRCQLCAFDPLVYYGKPLCAAHHIIYVSRGGVDELGNLLLACPNCHEAIHKCGAAFDYRDLTYVFETGRRSPLVMNEHLKAS